MIKVDALWYKMEAGLHIAVSLRSRSWNRKYINSDKL